ncbi:hypothetical protein Dsin_014681 [Dipteronia sinensis]|uniref:Uncharacterized protein n=1 Tax=Dipteronia sinensis TaxID=43782 RepID=A0AAE0AMH1_9ROSI|nr:hypothetical protein Dsin_014681 [Dipteronia sinensis]
MFMVCGYKAVIKFFPHQVSDFELAVSLLEKCHGDMNSASNMSGYSNCLYQLCEVTIGYLVLWKHWLPFSSKLVNNSTIITVSRQPRFLLITNSDLAVMWLTDSAEMESDDVSKVLFVKSPERLISALQTLYCLAKLMCH